jgi:hypothetical protein
VGKNKRSLDLHTSAGRANRDALEALITSTNNAYFADIAAGTAIDSARRKHDNRIKSIEKEATKLGLDKRATKDLIDTYGQIPKEKQTDVVLSGLTKVANALTELYIYQRSLAEGIPLASARAEYNQKAGPDKRFGGFHAGGWTGPGDVYDPAGIVHADEYVIKKSSRRKIEAAAPGLLDRMNETGVLPGHAAGGLVAPVELGDFRYNTTLGGTKVPSKDQVASKVTPAIPSGVSGGGPGWKWEVAVAHAAFPGLPVYSTFRPGAVTLTGNRSYHAIGRAVDFAPSMPFAEWVNAKYMARTRELITPWQSLNIWNGKRHHYSALIENEHSGSNAHDHWAMANGGVISEPVFGVGASGDTYSFGEGGRPETVLPGVGPFGTGGGTNVTRAVTLAPVININGQHVSPQQIASRVNRELGALAFVDSIAASPTVRLDLSGGTRGPFNLRDGSDFPPPPLKRSIPSSLLADGGTPTSATYDNRVISLHLGVMDSGEFRAADAAATQMQLLMRELDRPGNFLRYRADTTTAVFFRTFRSGPDAVAWDPFTRRATVTLLAEPFAYGLEQTLSPVTVTNNPAAGSNGMFLDITSPMGDVETPLYVAFTNGTSGLGATGRFQSGLAMRRRGTVATTPFFLQAEAMTQGVDTTTQVNSATFSGSGNNSSRCTFATATSGQQRLTINPWPTGSSVDYRGTYRVFMRCKKTVAG